MIELINISLIDPSNMEISFNIWIPLIIIAIFILILSYMRFVKNKSFYIKSFEINCAEIGLRDQKIQLKPNFEDVQIAYKLWVELSTRKIGLPIDPEHDVIMDIYDSWYEFFKLTRELIKNIPINKIRNNDSTKSIVKISIEVLNEGLRPHLTKWQAKYRRWYRIKSENKDESISPQQLQKTFPEYDQLIEDMLKINKNLINYREVLRSIAFGSD
jgi:hypothetical protein